MSIGDPRDIFSVPLMIDSYNSTFTTIMKYKTYTFYKVILTKNSTNVQKLSKDTTLWRKCPRITEIVNILGDISPKSINHNTFVYFCPPLKFVRSLFDKQGGPRSDRSSLFWVNTVLFYSYITFMLIRLD